MTSLALILALLAGPATRQVGGDGAAAQAVQDPASLDRLHDLILPPPVSTWPTTPGWWWLGAALLAVAVGVSRLLVLRRRARAYRREALSELEHIAARTHDADAAARASALTALPDLLKRTALAAYPRTRVAALSGEAWLAFLAESCGDERWRTQVGGVLLGVTYDPRKAAGVDASAAAALLELSRGWILRHAKALREEG